jgi:hypothetical protein
MALDLFSQPVEGRAFMLFIDEKRALLQRWRGYVGLEDALDRYSPVPLDAMDHV